LHFAVFDILLQYMQTGSWKEAFNHAVPKRKQTQKTSSDTDVNDQLLYRDEERDTSADASLEDGACLGGGCTEHCEDSVVADKL